MQTFADLDIDTRGRTSGNELPVSVADARATGSKRYFTGKPCSRGHIAPRYTTNQQCTECMKRQCRDFHDRHKERQNAVARAYAKADPEGNRRRSQEAWDRLTPDERHKRNSQYKRNAYARDPARWEARRQAWRDRNRLRLRQYSKARRARIRGTSGAVSAQAWEAIKAHFGYSCPACKLPEPTITLTMDHVIPVSRGGAHDAANIQPLCEGCNKSKYTRSTDYRAGWRYGS